MTNTPTLAAGPTGLTTARHLALPGTARRARLEDRIRTAVHRPTEHGDVRRLWRATSVTTSRRTEAPPAAPAAAAPSETPQTTPSAPAAPPRHRSRGRRLAWRLMGLTLSVIAVAGVLAFGAAGWLGALFFAAG